MVQENLDALDQLKKAHDGQRLRLAKSQIASNTNVLCEEIGATRSGQLNRSSSAGKYDLGFSNSKLRHAFSY